MIPYIIHYCWFGPNEIPSKDRDYMQTWSKFLPNYKIKLWNESNFNINIFPYVKEAYDNKKYAFVSDVARLFALVSEGGVYLDTDVEIFKDFSNILTADAVVGFESTERIQTAFMACCKNHPVFKKLLLDYANRNFILSDGTLDLTTNVERLTSELLDLGLKLDGSYQILDNILILPSEYACPYNNITHNINITPNTFCYHHFAGTWLEGKNKWKHKFRSFLGANNMQILTAIKHLLLK